MNSILEELAGSLSDAAFTTLLRERRLTHVRGAWVGRLDMFLAWNIIKEVIEGGCAVKGWRVTRNGEVVPKAFYSRNGKLTPDRLLRQLDGDASLIVSPLEKHIPPLSMLVERIGARTLDRVWTGAIVTFGHSGALERHYDRQDLALFHLEGAKRWRVYAPPVAYPVRGTRNGTLENETLVFDEILLPGDFLFMPAGYWHHCENMAARSLHLGIFFEPITALHVVRSLTQQWLSDEALRHPLLREGETSDMAARERWVKARLIERIRRLSLNELLATHRTTPDDGYGR